MKITGANFDSPKDNLKQEQLSALPKCNLSAKINEVGMVAGNAVSDSGALEEVPMEAATAATLALDPFQTAEVALSQVASEEVPMLESSSPESTDDDGDFLDLLVDTLDGEFDPELLI